MASNLEAAKHYEGMSQDELEENVDSALADHESGKARFEPLGDRARRTTGTVPINMRVPPRLLEQVKAAAASRGVPYQRLIKTWLEEAIARNAPEVLQPAVRLRLTQDQVARLTDSGLDIHVESA